MSVLCCVTFHPLCGLTKYTVVGTALGPTSTVGMLVIVPGVSQMSFLPGHQHRSSELMSQNCRSCAPGLATGAVEAAQTLPGPAPACTHPQSPQLLRSDPSPPPGHPLSGFSTGAEFTTPAAEV